MGVMTTKFLGKFGEIVFILRNAFIYRGLRNFLGDCYTLSPNKKVPPWYAVPTGSVVDSDDVKIDIFLLTLNSAAFNLTFFKYLSNKKLLRIWSCQIFHLP